MTELLSQETLNIICPGLTDEIELFVKSNPNFEKHQEAVIYALGTAMQRVIDAIDLPTIEKGLVVNTLIKGLVLYNSEAIMLHNERVKAFLEGKGSTTH